MDYYTLNNITIFDQLLIMMVDELFKKLHGIVFFQSWTYA